MTNKPTQKSCKFCEGEGLSILPLRYSVLGSDDPKTLAQLPDISTSPTLLGSSHGERRLGNRLLPLDSDKALGLQNKALAYAIRPLRHGVFYVLLDYVRKKKSTKCWLAYAVTHDGYLYAFNPRDPFPAIPEFTCDPKEHGIKASVIRIPEAEKVEQAWLFFSPDPLTKKRLDELLKKPDPILMQTFFPSAWLKVGEGGDHEQEDTIDAADLGNWVAEMKVAPSLQAVRMFYGGLFPTFNRALDKEMPGEKALRDEKLPQHRARLADIGNFLNEKGENGKEKGLAFVLNDAIGITQELNTIREDAFAEMNAWLDIHEYAPTAGERGQAPPVSNAHKLRVLEHLDALQEAAREAAGKIGKKKKNNAEIKEINQKIRALPSYEKRTTKQAREITGLENRREFLETENAEIQETVWATMTRNLDIAYTKSFRDRYNEILARQNAALKRCGGDHISWLTSSALQDACALYDKNDPVSGAAFFDQMGKAIEGIIHTDEGVKLLQGWLLEGSPTDPGNIALRALCYNQSSAEKAAAKAFADFANQPNEFFTHGILHPIDWFYKIGLGLFKHVAKETDRVIKMLQEIPRGESISPNATWLKNHPFWGAGLSFFANTTGRALSFPMRGLEKRMAEKVLLFTASTLGDKVIKDVLGPDYKKGNTLSPAQEGFAQNVKTTARGVVLEGGLKRFEHIVRPVQGDFVRVRMAGIVLLFEAVTSIYRAKHYFENGDEDKAAFLKLVASAFGFVGAAAELYANMYRVVTKVEISRAVNAEMAKKLVERARVSYGATKTVVAGFSTVAGIFGAYFDFSGAYEGFKKDDAWLTGLLGARGIAQSVTVVSGFITAYGDTEAFFLALKNRAKSKFGTTLLQFVAQGAKWANGAKLIAYRVAAMAGWIGILLTIGILVYDYRRSATELTRWCARSCFRRYGLFSETAPIYVTSDEEIEELAKAIDLTFVDESKKASTDVTSDLSSGGA
ncbi:MAG: hypothetical protein LBF93_12075 [Zoogloeaceae bacterium]|jgi:hypothetical protein|nr:hypothetical protein [Zoogloeaceae bacterium]